MPRRKTDRISLSEPANDDNSGPYEWAWPTVKTLVDGGVDPSRLLELYYWCREPGVIELIRVYLEMPERSRRMFGDYLLSTCSRAIEVSSDASGRLVLSQSSTATNNNKAEERVHAPRR
jgi:hypothetical protein